jgi:hypothetical protein
MTKPEQPKPLPLPLLLVYGKPTSPDLPQASWFQVDDRPTVTAAAQALKFSVLDITSETDRAFLSGVHEGVLKGASRMIVGSVAAEVYQRIEEHLRTRAGALVPQGGGSEAEKGKAVLEQITNDGNKAVETGKAVAAVEPKPGLAPDAAATSIKPIASAAPDPWDALRIGSHVVAKHWEADGEPYGWWIGRVTGFEKKDYVIVWPDDPKKSPPFKVERKHVAILHPSFDVKTEWDPKPKRRS